MTRGKAQALAAAGLTAAILATDQAVKIAVKTGMYLHQSIRVTDWCYILFTENRGMAFGMELFDKLFLTTFRIAAVAALAWYICRSVRRGVAWGYLVCLVMIMAGAAGNIFDCVLYGMVFNNPPAPLTADFVPWGTGYDGLMMGRVVDMFYFPLLEWDWPSWVPVVGGGRGVFFSPVFNLADASISCGVGALLLFCRGTVRDER